MLKCSPIFTCDITQVFPVVVCVVRAVHKFELRLVVNQTPDKWQPMERMPCSDRDLCF